MTTGMRALVYSAYGPAAEVLSLKTVPIPSTMPGCVLVKVAAASLNAADKLLVTGTPFAVRFATGGILRPRPDTILGSDYAGIVHAVGDGVTSFRVGDHVYGQSDFTTGVGAFAEYISVPVAGAIALKPSHWSFQQAAAAPMAAQTALQGLREGLGVQPGQHILINGASGGVGTFAVQLGKALDAHVTAVCSARNADVARQLGADVVIDYAAENFTTSATTYDGILDLVGNHSIGDFRKSLHPRGTYVSAGGDPATFTSRATCILFSKIYASQSLKLCMSAPSQKLLEDINALMQGLEPFIEKVYSLDQGVDAIDYFEKHSAMGKIVLSME
ncbi:NADPH:quinone reductase [Achlya hypogyna]|uniref:NADPH:quinone reductase n=1 Tax=Achlya hypogyna TaxID=1202772 RepID=A0A1V9ZFL0_ACHHY|nr:NADPH:quinone reductase [Achlya hypogyna]